MDNIKFHMDKKSKTLISVCIITYNHEDYISDAIEGALMQDFGDNFEIIIGDDCSTDTTLEICGKYQKKHPSKIRVLEREKNIGMDANWASTIRSAKGAYIALCEGDDYWTDKRKLSKQYRFLNENQDYSLCSHETYLEDPYSSNNFISFLSIIHKNYKFGNLVLAIKTFLLFFSDRNKFWNRRRYYGDTVRIYDGTLSSAVNSVFDSRYIHTASMMAKADVLKRMPDEAFEFTASHMLSVLWTALHGSQKHLKDAMSVRRVQPTSARITGRETKRWGISDNKKNRYIALLTLLKKYAKPENISILDNRIKEFKNNHL